MARILIVDDESQIRKILSMLLTEAGHEVVTAATGHEAIAECKAHPPQIVLLDINMPGMDGLTVLKALMDGHQTLDCIMMTAHGTIRSAVEAIKIGAFDYLTKPFDNEELLMVIRRALKMRSLSHEVEELRAELSARYGFNEIVGISSKLQDVFRTMIKVASVDATILIEGESGTGKELVARAIHRRSHRAQAPFLAVNCGAIPASLFEAELFGHERGAYTDARDARPGRFEQAQNGVIFLDEVGDLPLENQVKLLRILQDREVTRLGGRTPIKLNVRVIAATNVDLKVAVGEGRFREDLYWRLNVVKLTLPSLRERREDILLIVDRFLTRFNQELGLSVKSISPDAKRFLMHYDWPGNVRELENVICSAMIMCENGEIQLRDLPPRLRGAEEEAPGKSASLTENLGFDVGRMNLSNAVREATVKLEKQMIITRLAELHGNRTATARSLGISRKSLFNKMRQYGLGDDL